MHQRLGTPSRDVVDHRRQRLVVDVDEIDRVLGHVAISGHDERHRIAGEPRLPVGEWRARRIGHVLAHGRVPLLMHAGVEVRCGEDGTHTRDRERGGRVDAANAGSRERAAHEAGMKHPGSADVVDERAAALQQPRVLDPVHAGARVARCRRLGASHLERAF